MTDVRPVPLDPSAHLVAEAISSASTWLLTDSGDYQTFAVEAFRNDGTGHQVAVALQWPARLNHDDSPATVRLLISPEDAEGLAKTLLSTVRWLAAARDVGALGGA